MTLTPSQIEVLARFDGWEYNDIGWFWKDGYKTYDDHDAKKFLPEYFTSPGVLIEMRLKILKLLNEREISWHHVLDIYDNDIGWLILDQEYTLAAIKTSELIQKLEA